MNQKNTIDLPTEFSFIMGFFNEESMSPLKAKRLLRKSLRFMATNLPELYCENTTKYPVLIAEDFS